MYPIVEIISVVEKNCLEATHLPFFDRDESLAYYVDGEGSAYIPLWRYREIIGYAQVDEDMAEELSKERWHWNRGYATNKNGSMHSRILPTKRGFNVDHINLDKLDNRRENLRYLTASQNMARIY
jgi:hypothetical protein